MGETLYFDEPSIARAVQFVIDTGTANALGEVLAQGFAERLEQALRNLAGNAVQAAPSRDQLASMAMQGLVARVVEAGMVVGVEKEIAEEAYLLADAMLAQREKGGSRG